MQIKFQRNHVWEFYCFIMSLENEFPRRQTTCKMTKLAFVDGEKILILCVAKWSARTANINTQLFSKKLKSFVNEALKNSVPFFQKWNLQIQERQRCISLVALRFILVCPRHIRPDLNRKSMVLYPFTACDPKSSCMRSGIFVHQLEEFLVPVDLRYSSTNMRHFYHVYMSFSRQIASPNIIIFQI